MKRECVTIVYGNLVLYTTGYESGPEDGEPSIVPLEKECKKRFGETLSVFAADRL